MLLSFSIEEESQTGEPHPYFATLGGINRARSPKASTFLSNNLFCRRKCLLHLLSVKRQAYSTAAVAESQKTASVSTEAAAVEVPPFFHLSVLPQRDRSLRRWICLLSSSNYPGWECHNDVECGRLGKCIELLTPGLAELTGWQHACQCRS